VKIRVSYSELKTEPGFRNKRAEAEIEVEVNGREDIAVAYDKAWGIVKNEVRKQLDRSDSEDLPF
jgi:hypothetical protein